MHPTPYKKITVHEFMEESGDGEAPSIGAVFENWGREENECLVTPRAMSWMRVGMGEVG